MLKLFFIYLNLNYTVIYACESLFLSPDPTLKSHEQLSQKEFIEFFELDEILTLIKKDPVNNSPKIGDFEIKTTILNSKFKKGNPPSILKNKIILEPEKLKRLDFKSKDSLDEIIDIYRELLNPLKVPVTSKSALELDMYTYSAKVTFEYILYVYQTDLKCQKKIDFYYIENGELNLPEFFVVNMDAKNSDLLQITHLKWSARGGIYKRPQDPNKKERPIGKIGKPRPIPIPNSDLR